jgi:hypothetical protein
MFINSKFTVGKVGPEHPEYQSFPVTPADGTDIPLGPDGGDCRGLYITGAGNVNVNLLGGGTAVLTGLSAGQYVVVGVTRVLSTSTTATGILALY